MAEMEIDHTRLNKPKYLALSTAAILVTAFVLVQPTMQTANAVEADAFPAWDDCRAVPSLVGNILGDLIQQNSVKKGEIVKTIHAEKEILICFLDQGNLPIVLEITTYVEVFENMTSREVIDSNALVVTCLKDSLGDIAGGPPTFFGSATVIGCVNYIPPTDPVPTGSGCIGINALGLPTDPQGMDTHRFGNIVKTIETQKQIYFCTLPDGSIKKVDIVLFTEIYENMNTREITSVQNHQMRCVVLVSDFDTSDDQRDGIVESCIFSPVITASLSGIPNN
jgi:hypothetical protein